MAKTVLLIEDNPGQQEAITRFILQGLGYTDIACATLDDVQRVVPGLAAPPVGILLDFGIPQILGAAPSLETGRDCGLYLRGMWPGTAVVPLTAHVPIIAYTQYNDSRFDGWGDIIRIAVILKKHVIGIADIETEVKKYFI